MKRGKKKQQVMSNLVENMKDVPVHLRRDYYFAEYRKSKPKKPTFELVADMVVELPAAVQIRQKDETEE